MNSFSHWSLLILMTYFWTCKLQHLSVIFDSSLNPKLSQNTHSGDSSFTLSLTLKSCIQSPSPSAWLRHLLLHLWISATPKCRFHIHSLLCPRRKTLELIPSSFIPQQTHGRLKYYETPHRNIDHGLYTTWWYLDIAFGKEGKEVHKMVFLVCQRRIFCFFHSFNYFPSSTIRKKWILKLYKKKLRLKHNIKERLFCLKDGPLWRLWKVCIYSLRGLYGALIITQEVWFCQLYLGAKHPLLYSGQLPTQELSISGWKTHRHL